MRRNGVMGLAACAIGACAAVLGCNERPSASSSDPRGDGGAGGQLPYDGVAFPDRRTPLAVPPGGLALVANSRSDTLTAIDAAGGALLATMPIGRDPVTTDDPVGVAAHPPSGELYVALAYRGLHADLHAKEEDGHSEQPGFVQRLALEDLAITGEIELPEEPRGLAISDDGRRLVTAHWSSPGEIAAQMTPDALEAARGRVSVIETSTIEATFSDAAPSVNACIGARAIAISGDGSRAFVACFDEDAIAVVDLSGAELAVKRVPAGPAHGLPGLPLHGPAAVAVVAGGARVLVANELAKQVRVLDVASGAVSETEVFSAEGTPVALVGGAGGAGGAVGAASATEKAGAGAAGGVYLLTRDPGAVLRLAADLEGPPEMERALAPDECAAPAALAATRAGTLIVSCAGPTEDAAGRVLTLDAATLATVGSAPAGAEPRAIAVVPGGEP